jgi:hypothetical protein
MLPGGNGCEEDTQQHQLIVFSNGTASTYHHVSQITVPVKPACTCWEVTTPRGSAPPTPHAADEAVLSPQFIPPQSSSSSANSTIQCLSVTGSKCYHPCKY